MNSIDDEKLKFYLRNEEQIDEWAAIGARVPDEVDRFLLSCAESVQSLATDLGADFLPLLKGVWPKLFLVRPEWRTDSLRMGIGIQWHRGVSTFSKGDRPLVGLWVNLDHIGGPALSADLKARLSQSNLLVGYSSNQYWPAWRYETAATGFWEDLAPFRKQLVESVRTAWERFERTAATTLRPNAV